MAVVSRRPTWAGLVDFCFIVFECSGLRWRWQDAIVAWLPDSCVEDSHKVSFFVLFLILSFTSSSLCTFCYSSIFPDTCNFPFFHIKLLKKMKLSLLYLSLLTAGVLSKSDDSCSFREVCHRSISSERQSNKNRLDTKPQPEHVKLNKIASIPDWIQCHKTLPARPSAPKVSLTNHSPTPPSFSIHASIISNPSPQTQMTPHSYAA